MRPASKMYLMEDASAMNTTVGIAPTTPFPKLFRTGRTFPMLTKPATNPKIRK